MKFALKGKSVLVTGASSGIGWATALEFARRGAKVAVCARRAGKLAELAGLIKALGAESLEVAADVSLRDGARKAVSAVVDAWGGLDVLVNNAGINELRRFEKLELDEAESLIKTNLLGPIYMIHEALPSMKARGGGRIVNVSSAAGLRGFPLMSVYSASKFGLAGLSEALRVELHASGVRVTLFCPGAVATPMMDQAFADPAQGRRMARFAKTAEGCARKIANAAERGTPEVVYAEAPGFVYKTMKMFPCLTDWLLRRTYLPIQEKFLASKPEPAAR